MGRVVVLVVSYVVREATERYRMSELTLYLLDTDAGEQHLVRGREDAERLSLSLVQDGSVSVVSCEAVVPGSRHEADLVMMADSGWADGLLAEGLSAGLDIDPENFDSYAVLQALRDIARAFNDPRVRCCGRDAADCDCEVSAC